MVPTAGRETLQGAGAAAPDSPAVAEGRAAARPVSPATSAGCWLCCSRCCCLHTHITAAVRLTFLASSRPTCRAQQSLLEAQVAAEQAAAERQAILQQPQAQRAAAPGARSAAKRPAAAPGPGGSYGPGGTPAWKHYHKKKALGRQAEATLEMIFTRTQVCGLRWRLPRRYTPRCCCARTVMLCMLLMPCACPAFPRPAGHDLSSLPLTIYI